MHIINIIKNILFIVLIFTCAYTDYKNGKIYNKYLLCFLIFFVLVNLFEYIFLMIKASMQLHLFIENIQNNFFGFLIGFLIGFIFYILGIFKGGDAKLIATIGLFVGKNQIIYHFTVIIIVAGIGALYILIKNNILLKRLKRVYLYFKGLVLTRSFTRYISEDADKIKFPFAVYILLAEIVIMIKNII